MASSAGTDTRFVYYVPIPRSIQTFLLVFAGILLAIFFGIPLHQFGLMGTIQSFSTNLVLWLIMAVMFLPLLAWFICLADPPRSWLARLEFDRNCIRLVPKPPLRWIGEPTAEASLGSHPKEILLCRGSRDNSPLGWSGQGNFPYGFRVIVRSAEGHNRELKVSSGDRLSAHQSKILMDGIFAATGLPVRLVQREFAADGSFREMLWTPTGRSAQFGWIAKLAFAATPFIGGIVAGCLRANCLTVMAAGIALWLGQTLAVFLYAHLSRQKLPIVYWLSTVFTFSATYIASFAFVFYIVSPH